MKKIKLLIFFIVFTSIGCFQVSSDDSFNIWVKKFKTKAIQEGVSMKTVNLVMDKAIFLPKVIEYDRYQPEFYEDTKPMFLKELQKIELEKV